jgi:hypothetical protein
LITLTPDPQKGVSPYESNVSGKAEKNKRLGIRSENRAVEGPFFTLTFYKRRSP